MAFYVAVGLLGSQDIRVKCTAAREESLAAVTFPWPELNFETEKKKTQCRVSLLLVLINKKCFHCKINIKKKNPHWKTPTTTKQLFTNAKQNVPTLVLCTKMNSRNRNVMLKKAFKQTGKKKRNILRLTIKTVILYLRDRITPTFAAAIFLILIFRVIPKGIAQSTLQSRHAWITTLLQLCIFNKNYLHFSIYCISLLQYP